jgi:CheY-like chemotaxis protein
MDTKHIVLVEDNPDDELLTTRAIQKVGISSINVHVARDGVEALVLLENATRETLPDLVLLDLKLPKVNGLEVLRRVRSLEVTKALPIVVFTSSNEEQDIRAAYHLRVNSYIRKPVDFHQFSDAVQQICRYWLKLNISSPTTT